MTKPPSPAPAQIRLTISVSPEVHATFQRMAAATGTSISRAMGEWLGDTIEAAEFMTTRLEQARSAPRMVVAELQAMMGGLGEDLTGLMADLRSGR